MIKLRPVLLDTRAVARIFRVQPETVRKWVKDGCPIASRAARGGPSRGALMLDLGQVCLWICEQPAPVTAISDTALIAWSARTQRALHCLTILREEEDERRRARRDHAQAKKKKTAKTET